MAIAVNAFPGPYEGVRFEPPVFQQIFDALRNGQISVPVRVTGRASFRCPAMIRRLKDSSFGTNGPSMLRTRRSRRGWQRASSQD